MNSDDDNNGDSDVSSRGTPQRSDEKVPDDDDEDNDDDDDDDEEDSDSDSDDGMPV